MDGLKPVSNGSYLLGDNMCVVKLLTWCLVQCPGRVSLCLSLLLAYLLHYTTHSPSPGKVVHVVIKGREGGREGGS